MKSLDTSTLQRQEAPEEEEELQMKSLDISTLQRQEAPEEEEELQMKSLDTSTLQRQEAPEEEEELQMKPLDISTLQRQEAPEEDIQAKSTLQSGEAIARMRDFHGATNGSQTKQAAQLHDIAANHPAQQLQPSQKKASSEPGGRENNTGLPNNLKSGIENLSGYSMDDVKVHYNSAQPTKLQAHAYAQGTDIHVAPGQEKHLPHEAWHVVQQKQGRVKPTMQMRGNVNVNDDAGLEKEADVMGEKAITLQQNPTQTVSKVGSNSFIAQRKPYNLKHISKLLKMPTPKRYNVLKNQSIQHLKRITELVIDKINDPAVEETINMINEIVSNQQLTEINDLGQSANWANAMLYVDGKLCNTIKAQKSGLSSGRKNNKYGRASDGSVKRKEVEISINDSEATVFNTLKPKIKFDKISAATQTVELVFVSTNGACDGCKSRINTFVNKEIIPLISNGVKVSSKYKYWKPEKSTQRGSVSTQYGWSGDPQEGDFSVHTIQYN